MHDAPSTSADVRGLLARGLADEERRLQELEGRVARLQQAKAAGTLPLPGGAPPPESTGVTDEDLVAARSLLAESGRHLRELEGRLETLGAASPVQPTNDADPGAPTSDSNDGWAAVPQPGASWAAAPSDGSWAAQPSNGSWADALSDLRAPAEGASAEDYAAYADYEDRGPVEPETETAPAFDPPPARRAPDTDSYRRVLATPEAPPATGAQPVLPQPTPAATPADLGFRPTEDLPPGEALSTPPTSKGWEGARRGQRSSPAPAPAPAAAQRATAPPLAAATTPPTTSKGWADAGSAVPETLESQQVVKGALRPTEVPPTAASVATPATAAGWGGEETAGAIPKTPPSTERHAITLAAVPQMHSAPTEVLVVPPLPTPAIEPPTKPSTASLPRPTATPVIQVPNVKHETMSEAMELPGPPVPTESEERRSLDATRATPSEPIPSGAVARRPVEQERFGLERAFGAQEPTVREVAHTQQRILERLETLSEQVSRMAYAVGDVEALRARAEAAELACAQAQSQALERSARLERLAQSLESGVAARPEPKEQLVRLLQEVSGAHARRAEADRVRERLLAMSGEHQDLVKRHAELLGGLLGLLEEE